MMEFLKLSTNISKVNVIRRSSSFRSDTDLTDQENNERVRTYTYYISYILCQWPDHQPSTHPREIKIVLVTCSLIECWNPCKM